MTDTTATAQCGVPYVTGSVTHLTAREAADVDAQLMAPDGPFRFTLQQLMELAGLAVAQATFDTTQHIPGGTAAVKRIISVCGPGNNGGDGIVAARHLALFLGTAPSSSQSPRVELLIPKPNTKNAYFAALTQQAVASGVSVLTELPSVDELASGGVIVLDAMFGFSFSGSPRSPFDSVIATINEASNPARPPEQRATVVSVDVPSGWDVDTGFDAARGGIEHPHTLVSLTLPKKGVEGYFSTPGGAGVGRHYLGGRFVPRAMASQWAMPGYPSFHQVIRLVPQEP